MPVTRKIKRGTLVPNSLTAVKNGRIGTRIILTSSVKWFLFHHICLSIIYLLALFPVLSFILPLLSSAKWFYWLLKKLLLPTEDRSRATILNRVCVFFRYRVYNFERAFVTNELNSDSLETPYVFVGSGCVSYTGKSLGIF